MRLVRALFVVFAILMLPATAFAIPGAEIVVLGTNGQIEIPVPISLNDDGKTFTALLDLALTPFEINLLRIDFNPDPFVDYAFGFRNTGSTELTFMGFFFTPFVPGTYSTLVSSHSSSVTDGTSADGTVVVDPFGGTLIHRPEIDGVPPPVGQIGEGCDLTGFEGFSASCNEGGGIFSIAPVSGAGILGVRVEFTLSPGDSYAATGRVEILDRSGPAGVPEPSTLLLGLGVLAGLLYRQRRR